jgi:hypothetical protein
MAMDLHHRRRHQLTGSHLRILLHSRLAMGNQAELDLRSGRY